MSVWKFVLPYRDPSLLPRQWRIATGTQKSYKSTADKKEKRRLYELNRRKCKPAALASWQTSYEKRNCQIDNADGQNNSGDDCIDNEDETYVHEAFLADWRPGTTFSFPSWLPVTNNGERGQPCELRSQGGSCVMEQTNTNVSGECQPQIGLEFSAAFNYSQNLDTLSCFTNTRHYASAAEPNHSVSGTSLRPSRSQFCSRPYRSRKTNGAHLVKLAPDLPPVNLPPSVRIMPQSAFKSLQGRASSKVPTTDSSTEKTVLPLPHFANSSSIHAKKSVENRGNPIEKRNANQQSFPLGNNCFSGDKGESTLQMHPLLFQSSPSGDGNLPYYPLNGNDSRSSFNFFTRIQPQLNDLNLSLLSNPHKANQSVNLFAKSSQSKETTSPAGDNEFHPLLQKTDDVNSDSVSAHSIARLSVNSEPLRDSCAQPQNSFVAGLSELQVSSCPLVTCTKSSSPNEKAKELDLDIHLSFLPRNDIPIGSRDVAENSPNLSNLGASPSATTMETQFPIMNSSYHHSECCQRASILHTMSNKLVSGAHALVVSSNNSSIYDSGVNNEGEQSLPEIVMEQEELSDSDEEIGEHVEFECEEIDDSEGDEGSDTEDITDMQKMVSLLPHLFSCNA
ncbi:hypothetical protein U1Q18_027909 [Sarracenia purpurea var. burkii]